MEEDSSFNLSDLGGELYDLVENTIMSDAHEEPLDEDHENIGMSDAHEELSNYEAPPELEIPDAKSPSPKSLLFKLDPVLANAPKGPAQRKPGDAIMKDAPPAPLSPTGRERVVKNELDEDSGPSPSNPGRGFIMDKSNPSVHTPVAKAQRHSNKRSRLYTRPNNTPLLSSPSHPHSMAESPRQSNPFRRTMPEAIPNQAPTKAPLVVSKNVPRTDKSRIAQAKSATRHRSASPALPTNTASGTTPHFNPQPPAQNGFNFSFGSTTPSFGQQPQQNGGTPSFQFGATAASQSNQVDPKSTVNSSFTQPQQNGSNPSALSFFNQSQPQNQSPFSFGVNQTQQQNGTSSTNSSGVFGSFGQQPQGPQNEASKPLFSTPFSTQPVPNASKANIFGSASQSHQQNGETGLFGASTLPKETQAPSQPGASSIFSSLGQKPLPNGNNVFGALPETPQKQTSAATSIFNTNSTSTQQTQEGRVFGGLDQSQATSANPFSIGTSQSNMQTPKASNSEVLQDTSMTTPQSTPRKPANTLTFTPFQPTQSQPTGSLFDRIENPQATESASQNLNSIVEQYAAGKSPGSQNGPSRQLFAPIANSVFSANTTPSTTAQSSQTVQEHESETPKVAPPRSLFERIESSKPHNGDAQASEGASVFSVAKTPAVKGSPEKSLFDRIEPPANAAASTPPSITVQSPTTASSVANTSSSSVKILTAAQKAKLERLNRSLLAFLQSSDRQTDWSTVFDTYKKYAVNLCGIEAGSQASSAPPASKANSIHDVTAAPLDVETPKPAARNDLFSKPPSTAPPQQRKRLFEEDDDNDDAETQAPATEKRQKSNQPIQYPSLPESASNTAKLFQATLDTPAPTIAPKPAPAPAFNPSTKPMFSFTPAVSSSNSGSSQNQPSGFTPTFKPSQAPPVASGDAMAAFGKSARAQDEEDRKKRQAEDYDSDEETPEQWEARDREEQAKKRLKFAEAAKGSTGFVFSATAGAKSTTNSTASASAETPKPQPRSLFDRITPASPPKTAPPQPSIFKPQTPNESSATSEAKAPATEVGKPTSDKFGHLKSSTNASEFGKPTSNIFGHLQPSTGESEHGKSSSNIFGHLLSTNGEQDEESDEDGDDEDAQGDVVEKEQGTGDNTWKPTSPIKFGFGSTRASSGTPAAAVMPSETSTSIFGSTLFNNTPAAATTPSGKPASMFGSSIFGKDASSTLAPPTTPFIFGSKSSSLNVSRASTPGITTDGEGSTATGTDGNDTAGTGEEQNDPQIDDQTALLPDEKKDNEILFQLGDNKMALCKKYEEKSAGSPREWVAKGKGALYILKNKETGKTRVILKIAPLGKLAMNYQPVKGVEYKLMGSGKLVSGLFMDHIHSPETKPGQFSIQVKDANDAKEIARILMEERPN